MRKKKRALEKEKILRDRKAWEKSVPSHKVAQQEKPFENVLENLLIVEKPSLFLCKGTVTCTATSSELMNLPPPIEKLLSEFEDIFSNEGPIGLPPLEQTPRKPRR